GRVRRGGAHGTLEGDGRGAVRRARARQQGAAREGAQGPAPPPVGGLCAARLRPHAKKRYPSVYLIQGLTGQLDMWRNRSAFRKNPTELMDELFASGEGPPATWVGMEGWA